MAARTFMVRVTGPMMYSTAGMSSQFTLGVEEEFQIVDPSTWELRSHVSELMASSASEFGDLLKPEMHKSIVEVGTKICHNVHELAEEIIRNRRALADSAERVGLRIAAAGTHPFSSWTEQIISEGERYKMIVEELQELARSLLIFGLHVHVGIPDREIAIEVMNEARYFLPHLLALSELAVLARSRHRAEVVPHDDLPPVPAHRHSRSIRVVERVSAVRRSARAASRPR